MVAELMGRVYEAEQGRDNAEAAAEARLAGRVSEEWEAFETAYRTFDSSLSKLQRQRDDAVAELDALRQRLRGTRNLPHLGITWVMWGNRTKDKPASEGHTPPTRAMNAGGHTRSAPSLQLRPKR